MGWGGAREAPTGATDPRPKGARSRTGQAAVRGLLLLGTINIQLHCASAVPDHRSCAPGSAFGLGVAPVLRQLEIRTKPGGCNAGAGPDVNRARLKRGWPWWGTLAPFVLAPAVFLKKNAAALYLFAVNVYTNAVAL